MRLFDLATALFALAAAFFWFQASGKGAVPAFDPYRQAANARRGSIRSPRS